MPDQNDSTCFDNIRYADMGEVVAVDHLPHQHFALIVVLSLFLLSSSSSLSSSSIGGGSGSGGGGGGRGDLSSQSSWIRWKSICDTNSMPDVLRQRYKQMVKKVTRFGGIT